MARKKYYPKKLINALLECRETAEELLKDCGLRFASKADIKNAEFKETEQYYNGSKLGLGIEKQKCCISGKGNFNRADNH